MNHVPAVAAPQRLRVEHLPVGDALGVGTPTPRLSWVVPDAPPGWTQTAYEVRVARRLPASEAHVAQARVEGEGQLFVPWPFPALRSRERAEVQVRVVGDQGASDWSEPLVVEAGLLHPDDWSASIARPPAFETRPSGLRRPPLLRRTFEIEGAVIQARLYLSAHGLAEAELNGSRVGDDALTPGWTVYPKRLRYATYDVTADVAPGPNAIGVWLGDGWWRGKVGFDGGAVDVYGTELGLIAQLEVVTDDGRVTTIVSDDRWAAAPSPILESGLYEGETFDATLVPPGWSAAGFDDDAWSAVAAEPIDASVLVAPEGPPVRCTEELAPIARELLPDGTWLLDFGQNASGRLRLTLRGAAAGTRVTVRHAEVLQDGRLCRRPLREAASEDTYVCAAGDQTWEPRFTLHGFRYAEVSGWDGPLEADDVVARVYHSDLERIGWFTCSDPLVNKLHENVVWSMRSNFVDLPTDCPQRDERLGWTGDIAAFAPTAAFLADCTGMLTGWLADLALEQERVGTVPYYVPYVPLGFWADAHPIALWGDAAVIVPWVLYQHTGDVDVLARQYGSIRTWVDQVLGLVGPDDVWDTGLQLGDWLDPAAPPEDPGQARTDRYLVATAYAAQSARLAGEVATLLGHHDDAARYAAAAERLRAGFRRRWVREGGLMADDAQTAYALALELGLLEGDERAVAASRLAQLVDKAEGRIATGFAGTPAVAPALTSGGHVDEAYRLLLQTECPSWLYQVVSGATTTWERWDSLLPDGTVNPGNMTSFNHYALGAVADWLHRSVAGLAPAAPGYRQFLVAPRPGPGITSAAASHVTPYGRASVSWHVADETLTVDVTVPVGTSATIDIPGHPASTVGHGDHHVEVAYPG
ncbi:glycoside hydrolase family 78 protein [Puerhibacterium sp. TATVAM-FAB25]|uniref:glycoside hydrolase family 78 protein n=1 Tax=Puerhibacterium sp. TATVAM-FAB25 TaxID=3093699 RepID=UPI00397BE449